LGKSENGKLVGAVRRRSVTVRKKNDPGRQERKVNELPTGSRWRRADFELSEEG